MSTDNIAGIGPTPPPWCEPDTQPDWDSLTDDGASILSWSRNIGDQVFIGCDDTVDETGQWVRSQARIGYCEAPAEGLDAARARRLAAELLRAADLLEP
jgi:hypothetical protein